MRKPVYQIRIGAMKTSIWLNERNGKPVHTLRISRSFKHGEAWHESSSFFQSHLAKLIEALGKAEKWIALREPTVQ